MKLSNSAKKRQEILRLVKSFYSLSKKEKFIPAKTRINYAGRIYDQNELVNAVDSALDFWLTAGRFAGEFEKQLAKFLKIKYCLLTNSGSSANLLAISALTSPLLKERQLKSGDEIITAACGFPTTLNPIIQNRLTPVFIDVNLGSYNVRAENIERAVSKKTKALFIAHTLGNPADISAILKIVKKYNLWFIEDNCDSLGSKYKGAYTGSFGHISTCSFYPAHHITMGEGGAVLTNDALLRRIILSFRDWGRDCWCDTGHDNTCGRRFSQQFGKLPYGYDHKYVYSHIGYNLKVTDMQAAVGIAQLKKLPDFIGARKKNFKQLYSIFEAYKSYFILPKATEYANPSWFGFPVLVKDSAPFSRGDIVQFLEDNKIATRMLFAGNLIKQPAYRQIKYRVYSSLSNTDKVMNSLFWLGVYPGLNNEMLLYIKNTLRKFMDSKRG